MYSLCLPVFLSHLICPVKKNRYINVKNCIDKTFWLPSPCYHYHTCELRSFGFPTNVFCLWFYHVFCWWWKINWNWNYDNIIIVLSNQNFYICTCTCVLNTLTCYVLGIEYCWPNQIQTTTRETKREREVITFLTILTLKIKIFVTSKNEVEKKSYGTECSI